MARGDNTRVDRPRMTGLQGGVTDHALVRWLERSGALDVEAIRGMLARSLGTAGRAAEALGVGRYLILADGLVYVIENGTLVTVLEDDGRHSHLSHLSPGAQRSE